ncbi:MAG: alpha amylase C-terminal domain-containing protein [Candidatus Eremiobacteraeota bacterium]|nr:alpha amylase C-terminal domain-containing protein [Candidatus Eremiobacteraeota bacterium]
MNVQPLRFAGPKPAVDFVVPTNGQRVRLTPARRTTPEGARLVKFVFDGDGRSLQGVTLLGSWDAAGNYSREWKDSAVPMRQDAQGRWTAEVALAPGQNPWEWGVVANGKWAVFEEGNLRLGDQETATYSPTTLKSRGAHHEGDAVGLDYWAPNARQVDGVFVTGNGVERFPMVRGADGHWRGRAGSWETLEGKPYGFEVTTSEGERVVRVDPYARRRQGPQRGLADLYLDPNTGQEVHQFVKGAVRFTRFEVQDQADTVTLTLRDEQGVLDKSRLLARLGEGGSQLVGRFHRGEANDFWLDNVEPDGRIHLLPQGQAWAATLPSGLEGLDYRFELRKDGQLVGDANHDGYLSAGEAKETAFNDAYSSHLDGRHRWPRLGILSDADHPWKNDAVPRTARNANEMVIYQMHIGSVFGQAKNTDRTTFEDVQKRLDYFQDLGVNTLELLPTGSFEGSRDWGYIGSNTLAVSEQYGFEDQNGHWVSGVEALQRFVDEAHGRGFRVLNDVVYNHFGGEFNDLWQSDGKNNPWFSWSQGGLRFTPWGPLPAYDKEPVRQFITDHALAQLDELHFDGLRLDFTHPIHDQNGGGGTPGWEMLRRINREIDFFHPDAFTAAEEFPNHPIVVTPAGPNGQGGAGFDAMWNTEFQHRLVFDHHNPSVLQEAAHHDHTRMQKFMDHLTGHPGFLSSANSVTVVSNHDEVGNAERTLKVASGEGQPDDWARSASRLTFGVGMLSPGVPIFFQGDESLATNTFRWGIPSTWDVGWNWPSDGARAHHHDFAREVIHLRNASPALRADSEARQVHCNDDASVMAFTRGNEYLVVGSLNHQRLDGYALQLDGDWDLVLNSDEARFGGSGQAVPEQLHGPRPQLDLPAGGLLVYRRRGAHH